MPVFRVPIHTSYLVYLASFSKALSLAYFRVALLLCKWTRTPPSLLLHPPDFLGGDEVPALDYFPGMKLDSAFKKEFMGRILEIYARNFEVLPMGEFARRLQDSARDKMIPMPPTPQATS